MRIRSAVAGAALATALVGCGTSPASQAPPTPDPEPSPTGDLDCQGTAVSPTAMASAPPATSLPESAQHAFAALTDVHNLDRYRVLIDKGSSVTIGGAVTEPGVRTGAGGRADYQMATIQSSSSGGVSADGWWFVSNPMCDLQRRFVGLDAADVWLDPAFPAPQAADTGVHLLVGERECASGRPPGSRIKVAELAHDSTQVRIAIGMEQQSGGFTCQAIPPSPFSVDLGAPLGDRQLLNSAEQPPRAFDLGPTPPSPASTP